MGFEVKGLVPVAPVPCMRRVQGAGFRVQGVEGRNGLGGRLVEGLVCVRERG